MVNLAWYYSRKLSSVKHLSDITTKDILDFGEYFYHVGIDFVDGSRLVFSTLTNTSEIIEVDLDENQKAVIASLTGARKI